MVPSSHTYARSEVYLRIDLASVADLYVGLDYREVAYVAPFAHLGFGADRGQRLMPLRRGFAALYISRSFRTQAPASSTLMSVAESGCAGSNVRLTSTTDAPVV